MCIVKYKIVIDCFLYKTRRTARMLDLLHADFIQLMARFDEPYRRYLHGDFSACLRSQCRQLLRR